MNTELEKLAEEANRHVKDLGVTSLDKFNEAWQQKFAELIINHCGDIADGSRMQSSFPSVLMRQHFGLK